jgi:cyclic beta-1,2-glucan synthetase
MYRVGIEAILGITLRAGTLHIDPCIPRSWPGFELLYAPEGARYRITVENPDGVSRGVVRIELDGTEVDRAIPVNRDGAEHNVRVVLGHVAGNKHR